VIVHQAANGDDLDLSAILKAALPGLIVPAPPWDEARSESSLIVGHLPGATVVRKPWGQERWLVQGDGRLVLKLIMLTSGHRTSLQLHRKKEEVSLLLWGRARLVSGGSAEDASTVLEVSELAPGTFVHVRPGAVHRIEAVDDILLLEVSTPEVDDVVRLRDDWSRSDGRLAAEHSDSGQNL